MEKKYILIPQINSSLFRIQALRPLPGVKVGDLGGFVRGENNLSHKGKCWIYDKACVYDNAKVHDHARLYNQAQMYDNSQMRDNTQMHDSAIMEGNSIMEDDSYAEKRAKLLSEAKLNKSAKATYAVKGKLSETQGIIILHGFFPVYYAGSDFIGIGCNIGTFEQWKKQEKSLKKAYALSKQSVKFYKKAVLMIAKAHGLT